MGIQPPRGSRSLTNLDLKHPKPKTTSKSVSIALSPTTACWAAYQDSLYSDSRKIAPPSLAKAVLTLQPWSAANRLTKKLVLQKISQI
jgi:hypothetical protein